MKRKSQKTANYSLLPKGIKHINQTQNKIVVNIANTRYPIVSQVCRELQYLLSNERHNFQEDIIWRDTAVSVEFLATMKQYQKVNHFPGMLNLTHRAQLARNIKRMQNAFPDSYSFFPATFVLPQDILALRKFQDKARFKEQRPTFITKPQTANQGKGIYLWQNNIQLQEKPEVVQVYIERPLLYKGLKFDLRVYLLLTGCSPFRLYIFNEGFVRLATQTYQRPNQYNIEDLQMHLTNYSINKSSPKYISNDSIKDLTKGHKKSLAEFFQMLKVLGLPAYDYWSNIKDISVKVLIAGLPWLKQEYQIAQPLNKANTMCFELLGLDFLIQDNHKIHLLSIKHNPSFTADTPLDYLVKSTLIKDTLKLVRKQHELRNELQQKINRNSRIRQTQVIISASDQVYTQKRQYLQPVQDQNTHMQLQQIDLGSFQRIYPSPNEQKQQKFNRLISYCLSSIGVQVSPIRKKQSYPSNPRKRTVSQAKDIVHQTNQYYYPLRQKVRLQTLVRPQRPRDTRGLQHVFDRESFKQQFKSRQRNQFQQPKRRKSYYFDEKARPKSNAAQLSDILQNHQEILRTPQSSEKMVITSQTYI